MAKRQIAYWGEKGLDIYSVSDDGNSRLLYSGLPDELKPIKGLFARRILILGRDHTIRLRKSYPPAKIDKLLRAVEMEAPTLFPMENCSFYCRIAETYATHVILDIWAWEREPLKRLKTFFAFQYVIPEDIAFLSLPAGIFVYPSVSSVHVVACGEGRFFDAASYTAADFSKTDLLRFLTGLAGDLSAIREIRFYENTEVEVPPPFISLVKKIKSAQGPPFLEGLRGMPLKSFRSKANLLPQFIGTTVLPRFAVYALLAYVLMLFLTLKNYDRALADLKNNAVKIEKEISLLDDGGQSRESSDAVMDYETKIKETMPPLKVLDVLASELPEETYVRSLNANGGVAEVAVSARNPILLIGRLEQSKRISKISLKGSPVKDASTGIYNCAFSLEIKP